MYLPQLPQLLQLPQLNHAMAPRPFGGFAVNMCAREQDIDSDDGKLEGADIDGILLGFGSPARRPAGVPRTPRRRPEHTTSG